MIDKKQSRRFTELHDRLGKVYDIREKNLNDLIVFQKEIKKVMEETENDWKSYSAGATTDNLVDKANFDRREKIMLSISDSIKDLLERFITYVESNAATYNRVQDVMGEVMKQHGRLSTLSLSRAKVEDILNRLEKDIKKAEEEANDSLNILQAFEEELGIMAENYRKSIIDLFQDMRFDVFFGTMKEQMPEKVRQKYEKNYDRLHFFTDVFKPWHSEAKATMQRLTRELYPLFAGHEHTAIKRYTDAANGQTPNELILKLFTLVEDQKKGVVMEEKYGKEKIEKWRAFYCQPQPPHHLLSEKDRDKRYKEMTDEEWQAEMKRENELIWQYHNWEENRKANWYDAIQPLNFTYLPELNELEGDYWVIYAMEIRDEYENWKTRMEHAETVLEYKMDPELLFAPHEEFQKVFNEQYKLHWQENFDKRNKMITGEIKEKRSS